MSSSGKRPAGQRIRIKLKAYDSRLLDKSAIKIVEAAERSGARVVGPVPLPVRKRRWCVLKSPHVDKRGGEHYEIRIFSRVIDILDPPGTTVDGLMHTELPAGVHIEVKLN